MCGGANHVTKMGGQKRCAREEQKRRDVQVAHTGVAFNGGEKGKVKKKEPPIIRTTKHDFCTRGRKSALEIPVGT